MLTVLIGGNLTPSHDFMKWYRRKPPNFLEKSMCKHGSIKIHALVGNKKHNIGLDSTVVPK
jgi:hypothetical protein